jgi:hypothetical protein
MEETSNLERADIKTRWKKGQSGNPTGRRLPGAGDTLTGLVRTMMEQPVEHGDGARRTRLAEYTLDIVRRADAGDIKCRMHLLRIIDRGDRRKQSAQRNAKKAKTDDLREFEQAKAAEISPTMPAEMAETELVNTVSPTVLPRVETIISPRKSPSIDASALRRDPRTGHLQLPDGNTMSPEEEERLANPYWPHISPHLKKPEGSDAYAGLNAGNSAGQESPAAAAQLFDSKHNSGSEKFSQKEQLPIPDSGAAPQR